MKVLIAVVIVLVLIALATYFIRAARPSKPKAASAPLSTNPLAQGPVGGPTGVAGSAGRPLTGGDVAPTVAQVEARKLGEPEPPAGQE